VKAKHMTTKVGDLTFQNGVSHLVVTKGGKLHDILEWPGRPKQRPTNQDEMDQAIEAWFEFIEAEQLSTNG
jgi:hypothetical protein